MSLHLTYEARVERQTRYWLQAWLTTRRDVLGLLDALGLDQVVLGGHSFGGMLTLYMAAKYPERFSKLVIIDAAISWPSGTGGLLKPSLNRLDKVFPSWDAYLKLRERHAFH